MSDNPLVNLGDLTKPATVLIEKIADAVGVLYEPRRIVQRAKAEAKADLIRAESQIQITDLHRRALHRFIEEEVKRQSNMESIIQKALPLLNEESKPQNVEDDWIANFFDKCRIVSDEDMQQLWSRLLASEANTPGAFSRRTVNLLADLDKRDAELFERLCDFCWVIRGIVPLVYNLQDEIYNHHGISFETVIHLDSLGLIQLNNITGFGLLEIPEKITAFYCDKSVELTFPQDTDNNLPVGKVLLTQAGQELARVCGSRPVDGFFEYVYNKWAEESLVPKRETKQDAPADG